MPSPTTVLLVRHGRTPTTGIVLPGRAPGLSLAPAGRADAEAAAARIARLGRVAAVYASPLERAQETAAPIAREHGLAVFVEPELSDLSIGGWTGMKIDEARRRPEWVAIQQYPAGFRFPGGESFPEMQARMTATLARVAGRHPGETVVAVSHADPIKAAVAAARGQALEQFQRIFVSPGSITVLVFEEDRPRVLAVNTLDGELEGLIPK
ncbi:MAG TPA: histidine phosphatase family protein [Methylomirabilota bacterium]|jgi:probable phosphoglycerate mutase